MNFLRPNNYKNNGNAFGLCTVLVLLGIYLGGTVEIDSFHAVLHNTPDSTSLHSEVNESNACHQSVYHNKKEKSCEHKSHIVSNKKCALCHLSIQSFHLHNSKSIADNSIEAGLQPGEVRSYFVGEVSVHLTPRAPPVA